MNLPRWTHPRDIGNSTPVKLTILIPIVGYLIVFNGSLLHYIELSRELFKAPGEADVHIGAPQIPLRLLAIYFGLCLVAAASLIYSVFCPREVKRHGSEEYAGGDAKNLSISQIVAASRDLDDTNETSKRFINFATQLMQLDHLETLGRFRQSNGEIEVEGMRIWFERKDRTRPVARLACAVLFTLGLSVLAVPSLDVFFRVSSLLVKRMY